MLSARARDECLLRFTIRVARLSDVRAKSVSAINRTHMTKFSDLNLNPKVLKAVEEAGYETPTPIC